MIKVVLPLIHNIVGIRKQITILIFRRVVSRLVAPVCLEDGENEELSIDKAVLCVCGACLADSVLENGETEELSIDKAVLCMCGACLADSVLGKW
jgi:hypothetical protein